MKYNELERLLAEGGCVKTKNKEPDILYGIVQLQASSLLFKPIHLNTYDYES